jgi:hypothetical protein
MGNAFLSWNWSTPLQPNEIGFSSYAMEIGYTNKNQAGHALYRVEWPLHHVTLSNRMLTIPENTWVLYEVIQNQDQIVIRVDNKEVIRYSDPYPLPPGKVGFELFVTEDPDFRIYFDNVSICRITDPGD